MHGPSLSFPRAVLRFMFANSLRGGRINYSGRHPAFHFFFDFFSHAECSPPGSSLKIPGLARILSANYGENIRTLRGSKRFPQRRFAARSLETPAGLPFKLIGDPGS